MGALLIAFMGCAAQRSDGHPPTHATSPAAPAVRTLSLPRRPGFEVNRGQWPAAVSHVARDREAMLFLTADEAVWRFTHGRSNSSDARPQADQVRMRWLGVNRSPDVVAAAPQPARVNYLRGSDPHRWQQHVPLYARVAYRDLYPGIDLVFHDQRGELEYDLVVAPGVDPHAIRLAFYGQRAAEQRADGALVLSTGAGDIVHRRPIAYQDIGGSRTEVPVAFRVDGTGGHLEVAFAVGAYDRGQPLIIDPSIGYQVDVDPAFTTDNIVDVAVDGAGNLWVVGMTLNPEFPVTDDAIDDIKSEADDGFIAKLDPTGQLVYATYFGGNSLNCMASVAVDDEGNAFVAGTTTSTDFPVTAGAVQSVAPSPPLTGDGFLAKLGPDGQLLYSTYFGGASAELCSGRAQRWASVDTAPGGAVYLLISSTVSTEFPAPGGTRATIDADLFLARFSRELTVEWGRFLGSPGAGDQTTRVRSDAEGNAYVLGVTNRVLGTEHGFPTTPGAFQTDSESDQVHFIAKFAGNGDLVAATFLGAVTGNSATGFTGELDVDAAGNPYVAMLVGSDAMPVSPTAYRSTLSGFSDVYVAKLDPTLSTLLYGTYVGGSAAEQHNLNTAVLAVNEDGNAYVGSVTASTDLPLLDAFETTPRSNFLAKLTPDGSDLVYSSYLRHGTHVMVAGQDAVYVGGRNDPDAGVGVVKIDDGGVAPACAGDCDGSGSVGINELITGVRISLGQALIGACMSLDGDASGTVSIAELITAVRSLLEGC